MFFTMQFTPLDIEDIAKIFARDKISKKRNDDE